MLGEILMGLMMWLLVPVAVVIITLENYFEIVSLPIFLLLFFATALITYFLAKKTKFYWYCPLIGLLVGFSAVGVIGWHTLQLACCIGVIPALFGIIIGKWLRWLKIN